MERIKQLSLSSVHPAHGPGQAPPLDAAVITTCPDPLPPNARWREVNTRQLTLGFVLLRSKRKSIGLAINQDGLQIRAPSWVSLGQIDAAVIQRADWILDKLRQRQERHAQQALAISQYVNGGVMPYMGARIVLQACPAKQAHTIEGNEFGPADGNILHLALATQADSATLRDTYYQWLQQQARRWFDQRLQHFLKISGHNITGWRLSSAKTRWGSCSSAGRIMLNWRLIHFKHELIDYVIAHEVAHLREMNHSPAFWREVQRLLPDYRLARQALRHYHPGSLPLL